MDILSAVKMALRISTNAFDMQLQDLVEAAKLDLGIAGVVLPSTMDAIGRTAIIT